MESYCVFPLKDKKTWSLYQESRGYHWNASDIDLVREKADYRSLPAEQKDFVATCTATAAVDSYIFKKVFDDLHDDIKSLARRHRFNVLFRDLEHVAMLQYQAVVDSNHRELFSLLISTYKSTVTARTNIFPRVLRYASHTHKKNLIDTIKKRPRRFVMYFLAKSIFGATMHVASLWFKKKGVLNGFSAIGDLIDREVQVQLEFAKLIYTYGNQFLYSRVRIKSLVREIVSIETDFMNDSLFCQVFDIKESDMKKYIAHRGEIALIALGCATDSQVTFPLALGWTRVVPVSKRERLDPNLEEIISEDA